MVVEPGEKLFIVTRRLFEGDLRRHFVGEVKAAYRKYRSVGRVYFRL